MRAAVRTSIAFGVALGAFVAIGCAGASGAAAPPSPPVPAAAPPPPDRLSTERIERVRRALERADSQAPSAGASPAALRLRWLAGQLSTLGLAMGIPGEAGAETPGSAAPARRFLLARIPGAESSDVLLLVAPVAGGWGGRPRPPCAEATRGAYAPALVLELARVLKLRPLPYAVWIAFVDESGAAQGEEAKEAAPRWPGSAALFRALSEHALLARIRLALFLARPGEAGLRVARDLHSQRTVRELFFEAAQDAGEEQAFPRETEFSVPPGGHRVFFDAGFRHVLALYGEPASKAQKPGAGGERSAAPGLGAATSSPGAHACSAASPRAMGHAVLAGLKRVSALYRKVDRIAGAAGAATEASPPSSAPEPGASRSSAPEAASRPSVRGGSEHSPVTSPQPRRGAGARP